jgi:hypothetical protein
MLTKRAPIREHITVREIVVKVQIQDNMPDEEWLQVKAILQGDRFWIETMAEEYLRAQLPLEIGQKVQCKQSDMVRIP